jgi:hypothetical protein
MGGQRRHNLVRGRPSGANARPELFRREHHEDALAFWVNPVASAPRASGGATVVEHGKVWAGVAWRPRLRDVPVHAMTKHAA